MGLTFDQLLRGDSVDANKLMELLLLSLALTVSVLNTVGNSHQMKFFVFPEVGMYGSEA